MAALAPGKVAGGDALEGEVLGGEGWAARVPVEVGVVGGVEAWDFGGGEAGR